MRSLLKTVNVNRVAVSFRRYIQENIHHKTGEFRLLLIVLAVAAFLMLYINSRDKDITSFDSWPYQTSNFQRYDYFNLQGYIDYFYGLKAGIGIYRNILDNSQMSYFTAMKLTNAIITECYRYKIDPNLVFAVIMVESSFRPGAESGKGAVGLMQVLPSTAEYVADRFGYTYKNKKTLYKPVPNVRFGIAYLHYLSQKYGRLQNALWAYNYGPRKYDTISKRNPSFIPRYVKEVMKYWRYFHNDRQKG